MLDIIRGWVNCNLTCIYMLKFNNLRQWDFYLLLFQTPTMDEILRQKLITAINEENLSDFRDVVPYLSSVPTMVKLKEIVDELVDRCLCKKIKITKLLIQEILRLKDGKAFGLEFLKRAIVRGDVEAARELINLGVDVQDQPYCFLHTAIESKTLEIAGLLLAKGLNVNATRLQTGVTAFDVAIELDYAQGVEFLSNHGATNSVFRQYPPLLHLFLMNIFLFLGHLEGNSNRRTGSRQDKITTCSFFWDTECRVAQPTPPPKLEPILRNPFNTIKSV